MKQAIYCEDGGKFLVEVLSDETSKNEEGRNVREVKMRCIRTKRPSSVVGFMRKGLEFDVFVTEGYEREVGWTLEYV